MARGTSRIALSATVRSLAQSGAAVSHTGDTNETALATIAVPANTLGANGLLLVRTTWRKTGTAGTWTQKMYLGLAGQGLGGSLLFTDAQNATSLGAISLLQIANLNAPGSQLGTVTSSNGIGASTTSLPTSSVDTTANTEIVLSIALANAADTAELTSYQILAYPHA